MLRKLAVLTFLLALIAWMGAFEVVPAEASQTCSVYCLYGSQGTLRCCTSGTCSTSPGTLNCNGTVVTCTEVINYNNCLVSCNNQFDPCFENCTTAQCTQWCEIGYNNCYENCGEQPQTNFGC